MSSEMISTRSSPSLFSVSPSGDARRVDHGESSPPRDEAVESRASGGGHGVRLRRRWNRRRQGLGPWRLGVTWALDPCASWVREWSRAYLLACAAGLVVDPLFLYAVSVSGPLMCVFLDGWLAAAVTALRCMVDAMHAWNVVTQLRVARAARRRGVVADEEQASAEADTAARKLPAYARSRKGMVLDFFVILPVMQVVVWVAAPAMIRAGSTTAVMTVLLVSFLFEYLPKIYHSVAFLRRMQHQSGHIFGTIWWGIALNLMAYFVAAHVSPPIPFSERGGCVLVLAGGAEGHQVPEGAVLPVRAAGVRVRAGGVRRAAVLRRLRGVRRRRQPRLGQRHQGQERVPQQRRELPVWRVQVDRHARGQHEQAREDAAPHLLGPHDTQHLREFGKHDGVAGDRVQHHHHHRGTDTCHHAHRKHQGVPERDDVQEAGDAHAAAELGVVDETQEPAAELPAPGAAVRAAAVGGHPRRRRVPDHPRPPRGAPPGHQVPPLPRPRPPGSPVPAHGRPRPREHVRQGQVPHLPQRRNHRDRRGPGSEDAVHRAGAPAVQPGAAERRDELLHAGAGQLQRRRATVMVPAAAVPGAAAGVVVDAGDAGEHGGVRAGGGRRQVRDAALPVHLHQREGAAERAVLLPWVAHVGGRGRAAGVAPVQAPQDARVALLHPAAPAPVAVLVARRGEAPAVHSHPHLAQAQPGRRLLAVNCT